MNRVYPLAIDTAISLLFDEHGPLKAVLVSEEYVYDPADTTVTGLDGIVGDPAPVPIVGIDGGIVRAGSVTFSGVPAGPAVTGVLVYLDGNQQLLAHIDDRADYTPLSIEPNGGDITLLFDRLLKL